MRIIDIVYLYWMRTIVSQAHFAYDGLSKVILRYYYIPIISEEKVLLVVHEHRGHHIARGRSRKKGRRNKHYGPEQLLNSYCTSYYSDYLWNGPVIDWIIFKQQTQRRFIPTSLEICNYGGSAAIKSIDILWSEGGLVFQKLIHIENIRNFRNCMSIYVFLYKGFLDPVEGEIARFAF